jgi:tyrosyl-tRNA synthetase
LVTRWTPSEIDEIETSMAKGSLHPRDAKMRLAHEIVSVYHSAEAALQAQEAFIRIFQQGNIPEEMDEYQLKQNQTVLDVLVENQLVGSKSEGRRLFTQNGVRLDGDTLSDPNQIFPHPGVLQVGKRRFLRITE